jgi:hypothetical protein
LAASKTDSSAALAMARTLRFPSILERSSHSIVLRLICPSRFSRMTNSGTSSMDGIFLARTLHSSSRRAASMRRLVLLFSIVCRGAVTPESNRNSPFFHVARAYTASSPPREPSSAWTIRPSCRKISPLLRPSVSRNTPVLPLTLTSWMMSGR